MTEMILLSLIRHDPDLQMRAAGIDPAVVADYAEAMDDGAEFPAVILFFDGEGYWPGDGFHRIEASRTLGRETINAEVRAGGKRDAML
ncbi:hypothetical protein ACCS34_35575, partial [Rhizobium ruizarguesonis]